MPAYLHIPKTGGTYLAQREGGGQKALWPFRYLGHTYVIDHPGEHNIIYLDHNIPFAKRKVMLRSRLEKYFIISTARNIFHWLVSYTSHAAGWNPRYRNSDHYDFDYANKGVEHMIKTIVNREQPWPSRKFIHAELFSSGGSLMVDWLNRTNTLDQDLARLAEKKGLIYRRKEKQRVGKNKDYRQYYNDELIDLVEKTWSRELRLFGFSFEENDTTTGRLGREISPEDKAAVSYRWDKDELIVDGEVWK